MATKTVEQQTEEFLGKVLGDTSGLTNTMLAAIGDRLGLFKALAGGGAATSAELAARTGSNERYVREWLGGMASAGYVGYDPATSRFTLPEAHVPILAQEGGPYFFGGPHQMLTGLVRPLDQLIAAFANGGGVPQSAYPDDVWDGLERYTTGWFENLLVPLWIPAMPDVQRKLEGGARVADVGCGHGRAAIKLADAYPQATITGYDNFAPAITRAQERARAAGVEERVTFEMRDASLFLPARYDVITTFDVVHDAVDPDGLLRGIHDALEPDGIYVCLEVNCSDRLEENAGPLGALFHGFSVLYCMTTSLAGHGAGLGTVGLPEPRLRERATGAGFGAVRRVPLENPFNNLYELRP
jgi:SAM-dependent methyltransferase